MNKLNIPTSTAIPTPEEELKVALPWFKPQTSRRLIILLPCDFDCTTITRRLCELAQATSSSIQLLSLCKDGNQEPAVRRELVTLSAWIQAARIAVEVKVEIGTNWLEAVKQSYHEGDLIVCVAEQTTGFRQRPLSQVLESNLKAPVYILSGSEMRLPESNGPSQLIAWLGFLGIMIGFFVLQVKVIQFTNDWLQSLLLILLLIPEFGLLWIWNSLLA